MEQNQFEINLNMLKQGVVIERTLSLDDAFFAGLDQKEILAGDVEARVKLTPVGHNFVLDIEEDGVVRVVCDRCLEEMEQEVEVTEQVLVKLSAVEDDDFVAVDPASGVLELSWLLYELIEINLPIVHSHQEGECNPQMEELLRTHLIVQEEEPKEINE